MLVKTKMTKESKGLLEWRKDFKRNWSLYLMFLPVLLFYILFCYKPMYGALIAFKNYTPKLGFMGSPWAGFENFRMFFDSPDFIRVFFNTIKISCASLLFSFPLPIILALLINEIRNKRFKKFVQTASYLPHFISLVVICGMIKTFVASDGFVGYFVNQLGGTSGSLLQQEDKFLPIYIISGIWQTIGWDSIIYLAALSGVDVEQYEAAEIDGAGRFRKMFSITLPSISNTIIILFILAVGKIMNVGYEKIILLYNPTIYNVSDVISSYTYRMGFETQNWGYSSAVGLFNSVINLVLLLMTNRISNKYAGMGLW